MNYVLLVQLQFAFYVCPIRGVKPKYIYNYVCDALPNPYISPSVLSRVAAPPAFFSELSTIQIAVVLCGFCDIGNACVYIYIYVCRMYLNMFRHCT